VNFIDLLENFLDAKVELEFNILHFTFNLLFKTTGVKELYSKIKETDLQPGTIMSYQGLHSFFGIIFEN